MAAQEIQSPIDEREFVLAPETEAEQQLASPLGSNVMLPGHDAPPNVIAASASKSLSGLATEQKPVLNPDAVGNRPSDPPSATTAKLSVTDSSSIPDTQTPSVLDPTLIAPTEAAVQVASPPASQVHPHTQISQPEVPVAILQDEKTAFPRHTPFPKPLPETKVTPAMELSADQQAKYERLLESASSWENIGRTKGPITDTERMWLTKECLLRYLRATKWNEPEAQKRLMATLVWRREYGVHEFTPDYISPENETGKQVILGFDNAARPCLYLNPSRQNTEHSPRQIQHLVYMLERTIDIMPAGQESLTLLIDFNATKSKTTPSVGQGRQTMSILQNQYPERLGRSVVINIPWFVNTFLKIIGPFIDPVTREKLRFNEPMKDHVPASQLLKEMGGDLEFEYLHEIYWPAMNELAAQRRRQMVERWEAGGKKVGESEFYLRGGADIGEAGGRVAVVQGASANQGTAPVAPDTFAR